MQNAQQQVLWKPYNPSVIHTIGGFLCQPIHVHILLMESNQWITKKYLSQLFHYQGTDISSRFDLWPLSHSFLLCYLLRRVTISVNFSALPSWCPFFFLPFCNSCKSSLCRLSASWGVSRTGLLAAIPVFLGGFKISLSLLKKIIHRILWRKTT